jgi:hypothetical protein
MFIPYLNAFDQIPSLYLSTIIPDKVEKIIAKDCYIVMEWPTMLMSTTDLKGVRTDNFLEDKNLAKDLFSNTDCVLFFKEKFCEDRIIECKKLHELVDLRKIPKDEKNEDYQFYQHNCWKEKSACEIIFETYDLEEFLTYKEKEISFTFYKILPNPKA